MGCEPTGLACTATASSHVQRAKCAVLTGKAHFVGLISVTPLTARLSDLSPTTTPLSKVFLGLLDMALALSNAGRLTADIRLAQAVSNYEASLSDSQKAEFRTLRHKTKATAPGADDVMKLTAEIDRKVGQTSRAWRCFGPRFTNLLRSVQQFAALGDIVIGGSQNLVACGVWCVVRMSLLVGSQADAPSR